MANVIQVNPGDISVGSVSVGVPTEGTPTINITETTGAFTVPAGKLKVEVLNMGFVEVGDLEVAATVNSTSLQPGAPALVFEAIEDRANETYYTTPAISGDANGARVRIVITEG